MGKVILFFILLVFSKKNLSSVTLLLSLLKKPKGDRIMSIANLWCEIPDIDNIKTPYSMLAEQGAMLSEMTKGRLLCRITKIQQNQVFNYDFAIVAPSLANYSQKIIKIVHSMSIYPATLYHEQSGEEYTAHNDDEFMTHLGEILSSAENRLVIAQLNAQVRLAEED